MFIRTMNRYRWALVFGFSIALFLVTASTALMQTPPDPFGIGAARGTEGSELVIGEAPGGLIGTITSIINVALGLLGIIAVVIILYAGFQWMTAGGNEEKVTEAKGRIIQGVIGLAIIMSAYAIANFVITQLSTATGGG